MKILLINNNPVVSRLTALSARKEDIEIDEIQEVTELNSDSYDIVFVDVDSWSKDVNDVLSENIKTQKTVLFYGDGDEEEKKSFDISILKPFLPSEVSAVIRSVESSSTDLDDENHFNILGDSQSETSNDNLELVELEDKKEEINLDLDDELDLNSEFQEKLEEAFSSKKSGLEDDLLDDDLFDLDLKGETSSLENDLFAEDKEEELEKFDLEDDALTLMDTPKEEKSLEEDFSLELNELVGEETKDETVKIDETDVEETKKETKILDEIEIENIKGILTEDTSNEMTLDELMPPMSVMPSVSESMDKENLITEEKPSKEKSKKDKIKAKKVSKEEETDNSLDFDSNVLSQTLAAMPVENLRQLLSGAKINIKIKFPKSKK